MTSAADGISGAKRGTAPGARRARIAGAIPAVAAIVIVAVLIALGVWQLYRLRWKLDLIARVERRVHASPSAPPPPAEWPLVTAKRDAYRHVRLTGTFLVDKQTMVKAVTDYGEGAWVVMPLATADGTVLVNRGFVPGDDLPRVLSRLDHPSGRTTITGLLRITEPGGGFLRRNDASADRWFSRDVAAIARARGLTDVAPYFVDADAEPMKAGATEPRQPIAGLTVVSFPNNHLVYALTWFAMAFMVAGAALWLGLDARRPDVEPTRSP